MLSAVLAACDVSPTNTLFTLGETRETDDDKTALVLTVETRINPEILVPGKPVKINFPVQEKIIEIDLKPVSS